MAPSPQGSSLTRRAILLLALFACAQAAAWPASEFGRRYALLVGVQDYTGSEFDSLKYSENDVEDLSAVLRDDRYDAVTVMTVARGRRDAALQPTAANIKSQLDTLRAACRPGDTLLVAYAGHGVALRGGEEDELYLCPAGASLVRPDETLVSLSYLYGSLKSSRAAARVLIVDACRNKKPLLSRTSSVDNLKSATRPAVKRPAEGVAVLFSCSEGEVARESNTYRHGFFFYHLLDGLRKWARGDSGEVGVERLYDHVASRMASRLKGEFGPDAVQTPDYRREVKFGVLHLLRGRLVAPPPPALAAASPRPKPKPPAAQPTAAPDPEADVDLGYRMRLAKRYPEAIEAFTRALKIKPDHPLALIRRGACYYEQSKDRVRALADIELAVRKHPDFALGYYNRAGIRFDAGDLSGALADYDRAIGLDEFYAPAYANRGNVHRARRALNRAAADYDRSIALDATSPHAHFGRAATLFERAKAFDERPDLERTADEAVRSRALYDEAVRECDLAIAAEPKSAIYHAVRGDALKRLGRYQESADAYRSAIALDPANDQLRVSYDYVVERAGLKP